MTVKANTTIVRGQEVVKLDASHKDKKELVLKVCGHSTK
jgi:hypothetical protein